MSVTIVGQLVFMSRSLNFNVVCKKEISSIGSIDMLFNQLTRKKGDRGL